MLLLFSLAGALVPAPGGALLTWLRRNPGSLYTFAACAMQGKVASDVCHLM